MKRLGILAHSAEGGSLCFLTACREGAKLLGEHMHPEIVVSAIPMGLSMPGWNSGDHDQVVAQLLRGAEQLKAAGADFFICPDNTAHIVLGPHIHLFPLPALHIAQVICHEIRANGWKKAALLGTDWTMTGPAYAEVMAQMGIEKVIPEAPIRKALHQAIFSELCNGIFTQETTQRFVEAIKVLKAQGAECVIMGCTEIPLIINDENSVLPTLDSPRLLAHYGVKTALSDTILPGKGWIDPD